MEIRERGGAVEDVAALRLVVGCALDLLVVGGDDGGGEVEQGGACVGDGVADAAGGAVGGADAVAAGGELPEAVGG